jgi:hypothetical protein
VLISSAADGNDLPGCALLVTHGTTAETLFLKVENHAAMVTWQVTAKTAKVIHPARPGRALDSLPGTGPTAWLASVDPHRRVYLFRLSAEGELSPEGTVRPAAEPAAITWTADAGGSQWILIASLAGGERHIEAFRREDSQWHAKGNVSAADLMTPRPVPGTTSIVCGAWQFFPDRTPRRLNVSGARDLAEIYPGPAQVLTEFRIDDLTVLTSDDSGARWHVHPAPWPQGTAFDWPPEAFDMAGSAPMLRWVTKGRVVVARFAKGTWTRIADVPIADIKGLSGPGLMIGDTLVFVSVCYRTVPGESDSFRVAVIRSGHLDTSTILVQSAATQNSPFTKTRAWRSR